MQTIQEVLRVPLLQRNQREADELIASDSVEKLADVIPPEEAVLQLARGVHNNSIGVLAATTNRVLFISTGRIGNSKVVEITYDDILAATATPQLFLSSVSIEHSEGTLLVRRVSRRHAKQLAELIDAEAGTIRRAYLNAIK